jgi:hypothetical protein
MWAVSLWPSLPFVNFISYFVSRGAGLDTLCHPIGLESMPTFADANFPLSLDQGKHLASSLNKISLYYIYIMQRLCT